ncbi:MAG: Lactate utilization protein B [Firmicutes bacterium ADurb.Bin456]|nr:MAG: Lactate utilization protein B [Firmicutes bacterium ADurb.Bin456]
MSGGSIKGNIRAALANKNLRGALGRFADDYLESRRVAYGHKDFNALQDEIAAVKSRAAGRLEELAGRFAIEAASRGAKVFWAETAGQARDYILSLARERGVKTIVKSKSMASEEIHLNKYLAEAGLEVVETDLGEWIIQLCGQRPSHMVLPAIHMTRGEVAGIFSRETGEELPPEISRLVQVARENLRQKFLQAGLGITGANIAVAETGTLVMISNEGNVRLTTTLPPLHVAIVGLEKLVERFIDTAPILEALPRSATSQQLTSYVTMLTGPAPAADAFGQPVQKEMHIILLDNGRTAMQDDPGFKEALQCIRCASCLNVCPVFQLVGGHVFGHVYTGGIGTILTAFFNGMENAGGIQSLCLGCGRCKEFCPAKIDLPRLINNLRTRLARQSGLPLPQRLFLKNVLTSRPLFHSLLRAAKVGQKPFVREGMVRHLPFYLAGLADVSNLPALAEKPLRDWFRSLSGREAAECKSRQGTCPENAQESKTGSKEGITKNSTVKKTGGSPEGAVFKAETRVSKETEGKAEAGAGGESRPVVGLFAGCLTDFIYPEIGISMVKVLESMGCAVVFPQGQTCCGYPARQLGAPEVMTEVARQNLAAFEEVCADYILTPCPTCTYALKDIYPEVTGGDPVLQARAAAMAAKVYDFAEFICNGIKDGTTRLPGFKPLDQKVTYHDSCHLKWSLGITREPRELLKTAGADLVEMPFSDRCCGFGGSYSLKYPELSALILDQKLACIRETGAGLVAVECPGCLMQLRKGLAERGEKAVQARFLAEILADQLQDQL